MTNKNLFNYEIELSKIFTAIGSPKLGALITVVDRTSVVAMTTKTANRMT